MKNSPSAVAFLLSSAVLLSFMVLAVPAHAKPSRRGSVIGLGAEAQFDGASGAVLVYDTGKFHIDGILGFEDRGDRTIELAGRLFWVIDSARSADLGIGGGLGIINVASDGPGDDINDLRLEAGAQIRAFVVPNVALSVFFGLGFLLNDGAEDDVVFGGQLASAAGVAYYF